MKAPLFFFFLLPFAALAQNTSCEPMTDYWEVGASVNYPRHSGTAIGFKVAKNKMILPGGLFAGVGAEVLRFQEPSALAVPLSLQLTYMPLNQAIGPVLQLSPGYVFYSEKQTAGDKATTGSGGFTFYAGGGLSLGNALLTAGYSSYTITQQEKPVRISGPGIRLTVML